MTELFICDAFFVLSQQAQTASVDALDKRLAAERDFQDARRASAGLSNEKTMSTLLGETTQEERMAALDREIERVNTEAIAAAKQEERNVGQEERYPAPIFTE